MSDGPVVDAATAAAVREGSYVDWSCVMGGAVIASALSFVLFTFGSGIGLSLVSPWTGAKMSATGFAIMASVWAVFVQVGAFAAGGYLAGRMRRPWKDAKRDEVEFRDGAHGAIVWAAGVAIGAAILAWTAAGTARTATDVASGAMSRAGSSGATSTASSYTVDTLFRSPANRQPAEAAAAGDFRAEAGRILLTATSPAGMTPADRTYLIQLVAARTGIPPQEAEQRLNELIASAKETADRARKIGIVAAFLAAASLMAGLAAAWSAARIGGAHRDEGLIWRGFSYRGTAPMRPNL